jgi:hypothetical protein
MKTLKLFRNLLLGMILSTVPAMVYAVATDVMVVNAAGDAVASQTIQIFDAEGAKVGEGTTNDKGMLVFDFKKEGDYRLVFDGGEMSYTVTAAMLAGGGSTFLGMGPLTATALVVGTGLVIANNNSNDSTTTTTPSTPAATVDGAYASTFSVSSDPASHEGTLQIAASGMTLTVTSSGSSVTIAFTIPGTSDSITLSGSLSGSTFTASGTATVAGSASTSISMSGSFNTSANTVTVSSLQMNPYAQTVTYTGSGTRP